MAAGRPIAAHPWRSHALHRRMAASADRFHRAWGPRQTRLDFTCRQASTFVFPVVQISPVLRPLPFVGTPGLEGAVRGVVAMLANQTNGRTKRLGMVMDGILGWRLSLHAQIALPAATQRTAAITVDRCEHARQPVDEAAWNPVHPAVAARAYAASVNGTRCRLRPTLAGGQVRLDAPGHPPTRSPVACEKLTRRFAIANVHPP